MTGDGYTPLHASILASSIWMEDDQTRIVWMTMLALKDRHHFVAGSIPGLAHIARVSIEDCQRAITKFESPDKHSSNPDNEGRRIQRVTGGWFLLNGEHYQIVRDPEARRESAREWDKKNRPNRPNAKYRQKYPELPPRITPDTPAKPPLPPAQAEAEAEAEATVHTHSVLPKPIGSPMAALQECVSELAKKKIVPSVGIAELRSSLCVMYKRPETDPWDNFEEHLLVDIAKRPDWRGELDIIKEFRFKLTSKRFFPQKLSRLLEEWNGTLDRARRAQSSPSLYSTK